METIAITDAEHEAYNHLYGAYITSTIQTQVVLRRHPLTRWLQYIHPLPRFVEYIMMTYPRGIHHTNSEMLAMEIDAVVKLTGAVEFIVAKEAFGMLPATSAFGAFGKVVTEMLSTITSLSSINPHEKIDVFEKMSAFKEARANLKAYIRVVVHAQTTMTVYRITDAAGTLVSSNYSRNNSDSSVSSFGEEIDLA
jgi:hypothetical protein